MHTLQTFLHTYYIRTSKLFYILHMLCTGYFFPCSAYSIAVCVIGKKVTTANGEEPVYNYYVNDGIYGSFTNCVQKIQIPIIPNILQVYDICICIA